jgi:hypothetical protein
LADGVPRGRAVATQVCPAWGAAVPASDTKSEPKQGGRAACVVNWGGA